MIELVLISLCSWQIYRLATRRELTAWKWIVNFIVGYFAFGFLLGIGLILFYGESAMKDMSALQEKLTPWTPFIMLFLVLWFLFLRSRILQYEEIGNEQADENTPTPKPPTTPNDSSSEDKKDLSYFR